MKMDKTITKGSCHDIIPNPRITFTRHKLSFFPLINLILKRFSVGVPGIRHTDRSDYSCILHKTLVGI